MPKFEDKRGHRSDRYQYIIHEICMEDKIMDFFANDRSIAAHLNPYKYNDELFLLQDKLKEEFWKLAQVICTERQYKVMRMIADGYTQQEIADLLNINQSSITKCLHGNIFYTNKNETGKIIYGGIIKKMQKAVEKDENINEILERISELKEEAL